MRYIIGRSYLYYRERLLLLVGFGAFEYLSTYIPENLLANFGDFINKFLIRNIHS